MMNKTISIPNARNITRKTLNNGITVLVYENYNAQSVVVTGSLHGGSMYEDPSRSGLAALTAGALMRGTKNRDFEVIHSALEDIGADLDYNCGSHKVGFSGKSLAEDLTTLVGILADTLRYPVFPADEVERLRGERLTWLKYRMQDTRWRAANAFRENLYPEHHPYHYSTRGKPETLQAITLDEIRDFHAKHYGPKDMIVVIVGAVKASEAVDVIREYLGDWQNIDQPAPPELPELPPVPEIRRISVTVPGKTQSDVVIGTLGPSRFAEDFHAANIANSILGQFGMMGRVGDVVREREGMAYYAYSRLEGGLGPGAWSVSAGVNPANIDKTIDLTISELRRLVNEPVTVDELDENQSYFTGRLPLQLESNEGIAGTLHTMETYNLGLDYLVNYPEMIYSLTADDLQKAVRRYLNPDALVVAVAGPNGANKS